MDERICSIEGCEKTSHRRGWCRMHYKRWQKHGDPMMVLQIRGDHEARFFSNVAEDASGCWIWTGRTSRGYGDFSVGEQLHIRAHRWAYELLVGPIPEGLTLDHLCRTPACVHPWHLDPTPIGVNVLRGNAPTAINARKTHCVHGHPFDEENTYREGDGYRRCRTCRREAGRRYRAKKAG